MLPHVCVTMFGGSPRAPTRMLKYRYCWRIKCVNLRVGKFSCACVRVGVWVGVCMEQVGPRAHEARNVLVRRATQVWNASRARGRSAPERTEPAAFWRDVPSGLGCGVAANRCGTDRARFFVRCRADLVLLSAWVGLFVVVVAVLATTLNIMTNVKTPLLPKVLLLLLRPLLSQLP